MEEARALAMSWLRRLCFACFCVLLAAVAIGLFDVIAFSLTPRFAGCRFNAEIIPNVGCEGALTRLKELVFNLPLIFIYAPLFTLAAGWPLLPPLTALFYLFDAILLLALAYPVLALMAWRRAKRERAAADRV
jgi:hypothetical protein